MGEKKAQRKGTPRGLPLAAWFGDSARGVAGGDGCGRRFAPTLGRGWPGKGPGDFVLGLIPFSSSAK